MKRRRFRVTFAPKAVAKVAAIMAALEAEHGADACWPWPLSRNKTGYGIVSVWLPDKARKQRTYPAHRVAWVAAGNSFPDGKVTIDHTCHFPPCVNGAHLRLLSLEDNAKDAADYTKSKQFYASHCFKGHPLSGPNCRVDRLRSGRLTKVCRTCEAGRRERYLNWSASKSQEIVDVR